MNKIDTSANLHLMEQGQGDPNLLELQPKMDVREFVAQRRLMLIQLAETAIKSGKPELAAPLEDLGSLLKFLTEFGGDFRPEDVVQKADEHLTGSFTHLTLPE
jgi:hypothetical protein